LQWECQKNSSVSVNKFSRGDAWAKGQKIRKYWQLYQYVMSKTALPAEIGWQAKALRTERSGVYPHSSSCRFFLHNVKAMGFKRGKFQEVSLLIDVSILRL
jgi:hypothetical protein